MSQTSYSYDLRSGFAGLIADTGHRDIVSRVSLADMPYGVLGVMGVLPDSEVKLPASSGDVTGSKVLGVVVSQHTQESQYPGGSTPSFIPASQTVGLMRKGRIWVNVEEAVVAGDQPFVRFAAGSFSQLGAFRKSADTATAVALPNARYVTSQATIGGVAVVELEIV